MDLSTILILLIKLSFSHEYVIQKITNNKFGK